MATNIYRVHYGYFTSGKLTSPALCVDMVAADNKEATLKAVLSSNNFTRPGMTLQIISVQNQGPFGGDNGSAVIS